MYTLYTQARYRTVMKVNVFRLCTKDHTTALFLAVLVIVEAKMGEGSLQGKRDIRNALRCNFLVKYSLNDNFVINVTSHS